MKHQLEGFWAQDIWATTKIPVPDNDPDRHRKNRYLRFATHSSGVNAELKSALKSYFIEKKWSPWHFENLAGQLNLFTKFFNQIVEKDELETLLAWPIKSWELRFSRWLQKNHPQGFDPKTHSHRALGCAGCMPRWRIFLTDVMNGTKNGLTYAKRVYRCRIIQYTF
jgi:hypothetical protein